MPIRMQKAKHPMSKSYGISNPAPILYPPAPAAPGPSGASAPVVPPAAAPLSAHIASATTAQTQRKENAALFQIQTEQINVDPNYKELKEAIKVGVWQARTPVLVARRHGADVVIYMTADGLRLDDRGSLKAPESISDVALATILGDILDTDAPSKDIRKNLDRMSQGKTVRPAYYGLGSTVRWGLSMVGF